MDAVDYNPLRTSILNGSAELHVTPLRPDEIELIVWSGSRAHLENVVRGPEIAEVYDATYSAMAQPAVLEPIVGLLAELARDGPALEFAVGTGRIALPLSSRGVPVRGIELSPHMVEQLRAKPGADAVPVTIGDMTTTHVRFGERAGGNAPTETLAPRPGSTSPGRAAPGDASKPDPQGDAGPGLS